MGSIGTKDSGKRYQLDTSKVGENFNALPWAFQNNIQTNLSLSEAMRNNIDSDKPVKMTDEWTTSLKGTKEKRKVITKYENGRLFYDVKSGNKFLLRDGTVEQAANQVATFYRNALRRVK